MEENKEEIPKLKILNTSKYLEITNYINKYRGLAMDCEVELHKKFHDVNALTLSNIMNTESVNKIKNNYHKLSPTNIMDMFNNEIVANPNKLDIIVELSKRIGLPPTVVCRILIGECVGNKSRKIVTQYLKYPYLLPNPSLAFNVQNGISSDNIEGPINDTIRRFTGEEYEILLKEKARAIGLHYLDESVLRRIGFDKTPDLKLAIPCLYKGKVINWIESKAMFGDKKTHCRYLNKQYSSYSNRFGPGIVIYWFGFQSNILNMSNYNNLIILDSFPKTEDIELLEIK